MDGFALWQRFFHDATGNVFALRFVEVEKSIDATVRTFAFAFFQWTRADQRQRPMLELEFVELCESLRAREIGRLTFFFELDLLAKRILQSALDQIDREIGDVDPDPLSIQLLRRMNRRAASTKRIEHHITRIC